MLRSVLDIYDAFRDLSSWFRRARGRDRSPGGGGGTPEARPLRPDPPVDDSGSGARPRGRPAGPFPGDAGGGSV